MANPNGNPQNLTPWQKGQSGNPNGAPKKGQTYTDLLQQLGDEPVDSSTGEVTRKKALLSKLWEMAVAGNLSAIKYIMDRTDGKPKETVAHEGGDGEPIKIQHVFGRNGNSSVEPEIPPNLN